MEGNGKIKWSENVITNEQVDKQTTLNMMKLVRCYVWSIALYGSEAWTLLHDFCQHSKFVFKLSVRINKQIDMNTNVFCYDN